MSNELICLYENSCCLPQTSQVIPRHQLNPLKFEPFFQPDIACSSFSSFQADLDECLAPPPLQSLFEDLCVEPFFPAGLTDTTGGLSSDLDLCSTDLSPEALLQDSLAWFRTISSPLRLAVSSFLCSGALPRECWSLLVNCTYWCDTLTHWHKHTLKLTDNPIISHSNTRTFWCGVSVMVDLFFRSDWCLLLTWVCVCELICI